MNNEDKQFAHIQKMVNEIMEPIREMQKMILEPLKPIRDMQEQIRAQCDKTLAPMRQINQRYRDIWASVLSEYSCIDTHSASLDMDFSAINKASKALKYAFSEPLTNAELTSLAHTYRKAIKIVAEPAIELNVHTENDYVTVSEDSVKEFEIPETIAIPIGRSRIRIKTDVFVGILLTIFFGFADLFITVHSSYKNDISETRYQERQSQHEQEENQMFHESIDTSMSSQAKTIEDLKESILTFESAVYSELIPQADSQTNPVEDKNPRADVLSIDNLNELMNTGEQN